MYEQRQHSVSPPANGGTLKGQITNPGSVQAYVFVNFWSKAAVHNLGLLAESSRGAVKS